MVCDDRYHYHVYKITLEGEEKTWVFNKIEFDSHNNLIGRERVEVYNGAFPQHFREDGAIFRHWKIIEMIYLDEYLNEVAKQWKEKQGFKEVE